MTVGPCVAWLAFCVFVSAGLQAHACLGAVVKPRVGTYRDGPTGQNAKGAVAPNCQDGRSTNLSVALRENAVTHVFCDKPAIALDHALHTQISPSSLIIRWEFTRRCWTSATSGGRDNA